MNINFYNLRTIIFFLLTFFLSNITYAELRVDVAIPQEYTVQDNISTTGFDNPESVTAFNNKFKCFNSECGGNGTILNGLSLVVYHHTAAASLIGGGAWFNIKNAQTGQYVTSCQLVAYNKDWTATRYSNALPPTIEIFCYNPSAYNGRYYSWSIIATRGSGDNFSNPHIQVYFGPTQFSEYIAAEYPDYMTEDGKYLAGVYVLKPSITFTNEINLLDTNTNDYNGFKLNPPTDFAVNDYTTGNETDTLITPVAN